MLKKIAVLLLVMVMSFSVVGEARAADFRIPDQSGNVTVKSGEQVRNLYVGGNVVTIDADVEKSLYAGGNVVTVDGDVEGEVFVGGSTVIIRGNVGGSVHAGGGTVVIEGKVADDVIVGGGNLRIADSAEIGGDLVIGGGSVSVEGPVAGDVGIGAGEVVLNSKVGGRIDGEVGSLTLGDMAEVKGDINYKSPEEAKVDEKAVVGGMMNFQRVEEAQVQAKRNFEAERVLRKVGYVKKGFSLLMSIVIGLALVFLFRKWTKVTVKEALTNFWPGVGVGFLALILVPLVVIVLLVSLIGAWFGGFLGMLYALSLFLSGPVASIILGSLLFKLFGEKKGMVVVDWKAVVAGAIGMGVLGLIPILGWLVKAAFVLLALGTLYRLSWGMVKTAK